MIKERDTEDKADDEGKYDTKNVAVERRKIGGVADERLNRVLVRQKWKRKGSGALLLFSTK